MARSEETPIDDAIGLHQVLDSGAFAEEFGIADDVDVSAGVVAADGLRDLLAGLDRDGALVDDDAVFLDVDGDFAGDALDKAEIDAAVGLGRRGHGDKDDLRRGDGVGDGGGEGKASGGDVLLHELLKAGLVNGNVTGAELLDFLDVVIHADDVMAHFGETSARDQPNVTRTNNC